MKDWGKFLVYVLLGGLFLSGCEYNSLEIEKGKRGDILSFELLEQYSVTEAGELMDANIPAIFTQSIRPKYGLVLYKVNYRTLGVKGELVEASGAVVLPQGLNTGAPLFIYQHGTIHEKEPVPSRGTSKSQEAFFGVVMAGQGFVSAVPDYLGLGDSKGLHPYLHAATEAAAGLDLLRAARTLAADNSVNLNGQLFVTGYSQGGHAAMALFKDLETNHQEEFAVTAAAPMAGPYSLSGVMVEVILSDDPYPTPSYLPYTLFSYDLVYDLYDSPSEYLKAPYDTLLPPLFDGTHSGGAIDAMLPSRPKEILRPEVLAEFSQDLQHPLRLALRENDLYDWYPKAPIKLFHCEGDDQVSAENSKVAYQTFVANGVTDIELIQPDLDLGTLLLHTDCVLFAALGMITWFLELKE